MLEEIRNHNSKEKVLNWKVDDLTETKKRIEIFKNLDPELQNVIISNLSINYILDGYATQEEISVWYNEDKSVNVDGFLSFMNKKIEGLVL